MRALKISFENQDNREEKYVPLLRTGHPIMCIVSLKMQKGLVVKTEITIEEHYEGESLLWLHRLPKERFTLNIEQANTESADQPEKIRNMNADHTTMESKLEVFRKIENELKESGLI